MADSDCIVSTCANCGERFEYGRSGAGRPRRYCSRACRDALRERTRIRYSGTCQRCGRPFETVNETVRHCSPACSKFDQSPCKVIPCAACGKEFRQRTQKSKCCSGECGKEYSRRYAATVVQKWFTCKRCGSRFKNNRSAANLFCSRECAFAHKTDKSKGLWIHWWFKDCEICGKRFVGQLNSRLCGDRECTLADARNRWQETYEPVSNEHPCRRCGKVAVYGRTRFCDLCRVESHRIYKRDHRNHRSRARKSGCIYTSIKRSDIIARHGTKCWICGKPIDMKGKANTPLSFTVDHVVPLSLGGWHDLPNLRPAHHSCNSDRGAEYHGQLMLAPVESTA
jgi:5-methylcytosine-specific restriction endonuclease McrA